MMHNPIFGWITVGLYVGLAVSRATYRPPDWRTAAIAVTFAVSNFLIFCWKGKP
jgi:hypothetical protein